MCVSYVEQLIFTFHLVLCIVSVFDVTFHIIKQNRKFSG